MEQRELRKIILDYLESHHTLSLATVGGDGLPHAATLFYVSRDLEIFFVSSPASRHGLNLTHNSQVSVTIDEDYDRWRLIKGIQMEGRVESAGGIWEQGRLALSFVKKFPDVADFFSAPQRLGEKIFSKVEGVKFYALLPSRIYFIDNERGFGHREELLLPGT